MADHPKIKKWIKKCKRNHRGSQEKVYRFYFTSLEMDSKSYTKDTSEQLTLINDTFLTAFKKIGQFELKGSFEGWLRKILYYKMIDMKRKDKSRFHVEYENNTGTVNNGSLESLYYDELREKIEILPEATKRVFVLFAIEGFKHIEIAEKLEISEGTSKWHVSKAREILQGMLDRKNRIAK